MKIDIMKQIFTILFLFLSLGFVKSQSCNIGNQTTNPSFTNTGGFQADYLLGVRFNLASEGILNSFNLLGNNTGSQVQMALYDDNNNVPNNLIATSAVGTVTSGIVTLSTATKNLPAGNYWIMAIYTSSGYHSSVSQLATGNKVYYKSLTFGSAIPANASNFDIYTGQDFLYYLGITCGTTLNNSDLEKNEISVLFPNPTQDFISVITKTNNDKYTIYDTSGKNILSGNIEKNQKINVQKLSTGTYIIKLMNSGETIQFIKK